jgi:hypothetical protein
LYLRNFSDDRLLARPQRVPGLGTLVRAWFLLGRSEEKHIAAVLESVGPVVAVSVPGERAPNDGILRMDLPDAWQGPVRTLIRDARLVVLVLGAGRWMPSRVRGIIHFSAEWRPTYVPLPRVPLRRITCSGRWTGRCGCPCCG